MDTDNFIKAAMDHFSKYDKNNSNFIEKGELTLILTHVAKELKLPIPSDDEISQTLKDFDKNNDNKISKEEFIKLFEVIYEMKKEE